MKEQHEQQGWRDLVSGVGYRKREGDNGFGLCGVLGAWVKVRVKAKLWIGRERGESDLTRLSKQSKR